MQIIGRSWWAGCDVIHAFCFSGLLFQSPVTKALAMTRKVIRKIQFNLSLTFLSSKILSNNCIQSFAVALTVGLSLFAWWVASQAGH